MRTKITNHTAVFGRHEILPIYEAVTRRFFTALIIVLMALVNNFSQSLTPVNLRTAGNYVILAKSGISTIPTSAIVGDIGVSPIDQTAITGFSLIADPSNVFATSSQVTGRIFAADFADPTPSNLTTAVGDKETAYIDAAERNPSTSIRYNLEKDGMVSLKIYNLLGKEVATLVNTNQNAGSYTVQFNTNLRKLKLASGVYLYRLETESFVSVKKFVLLK